jgi:acyl-CoA dehydrogenase
MQGLGSGAITLDGSDGQKRNYLPRVAAGTAVAAFALSEPEAGSDVGAMQLRGASGRRQLRAGWRKDLDLERRHCGFLRGLRPHRRSAGRTRGISAFIVDADTPGLEIAERIEVIAPHPLARLRFSHCRIPAGQRLGEPGQGFKLAMRTLDIFRTSVAAAALGFARRALDEALVRARTVARCSTTRWPISS